MGGRTRRSVSGALGLVIAVVGCEHGDELTPREPARAARDVVAHDLARGVNGDPHGNVAPGSVSVSVERWTHTDDAATFEVMVDGAAHRVIIDRDARRGSWSARIVDPRSGTLGFGVSSGAVGATRYLREYTSVDTCLIVWQGDRSPRETYRIGERTWTRPAHGLGADDLRSLDELFAGASSLLENPAGEALMTFLTSAPLQEFLVSEGVIADDGFARYQPSYCPDGLFCDFAKCVRFDHGNAICMDCYGVAACIVQILFCRDGGC